MAVAVGMLLGLALGYALFSIGATSPPSYGTHPIGADRLDVRQLAESVDSLVAAMQLSLEHEMEAPLPVQPGEATREVAMSEGELLSSPEVRALTGQLERLLGRMATIVPADDGYSIKRRELPRPPINPLEFTQLLQSYPGLGSRDGKVPLELALLGVNQVIERFGWPDEYSCPLSRDGVFELTYVDSLSGLSLRGVRIVCSTEQTFSIRFYSAE